MSLAGMAATWPSRFPKLAEPMDTSREHWPQVSSTTPIERLNGEVKRRSDVIGIFPNPEAAVRLWKASLR